MAATSDQSDSAVDFAAWLTGHRRAILDAIRFYGGESHTSNIREYSGVPRGSFNHHIERLLNPPEKLRGDLDWLDGEGLIEVTGEVDVGKPAPARQFALTEAGEKAFEKVVDGTGIRAADVRDLQQRVQELEGVQERVAELEAENEELADAFNDLRAYVKSIEDGTG